MFERLEAEFTSRLGRECLAVPSNRLGLFMVLKHLMPPGGRLLMSPLSADEILFLVLAAGLRPVMAPLCRRSGNIDPTRVDELHFDGVLTTNLYGVPDDVLSLGKTCAERDIPLIEDAAHALQTTVADAPIGTFGAAGVFSLSKHAGAAPGGVIAMSSPSQRPALLEMREQWSTARYRAVELTALFKAMARNALAGSMFSRHAWHMARALNMIEHREGHRIALRRAALAARLSASASSSSGPGTLNSWIQADNHHYRMTAGILVENYALRRLKALDLQRERRLAGVARLAGLPTAAAAVRDHVDQPLFRVPLLVEERERAITELRRQGVIIGYIYDPPFDDYARDLTEPSPSPQAARWWAQHVLPIDPIQADRAWPVLSKFSAADLPALPI
ncbi:DegT/DnrJ/EryC1/StrS family aminotransferase [Sinosporangium siamense]|uniref:DegT/DnrJ/EryC1/StrS aminotransferase family protein n=1 Tax=Sinosporangium siamense TaxID=1367973 RepID=A0A919V944_9ACTN|nr:DegT/DnrJ/EryC1/StrS family aminotransferase [Sinosporangium siamense]GII96810.1 hypothetical protein Ssi02_70410 [Sinosporangium siamense]